MQSCGGDAKTRTSRPTFAPNEVRLLFVLLTTTSLLFTGCSPGTRRIEETHIQTDEPRPPPEITPSAMAVTEGHVNAEITPNGLPEPARFIDACPGLAVLDTGATWPSGSILFARPRESGSSLPDRVYAFDLETETLQDIATIPADYFLWPAILSPDGSQLYVGNTSEEPYEVQRVELAGGSEVEQFPIHNRWVTFSSWGLTDDIVQLQDFGEIDGSIVKIDFFRLNTDSGVVEEFTLELVLPEYRHSAFHPQESYFSVSPDRTLVIYTSESDKGIAAVKLVLYSLGEDEQKWSYALPYSLPLPMPSWAADGSKAAIAYYVDSGGYDFDVFVLSRDGGTEVLATSIPGESVGTWVNFLSWSPDGRFLSLRLGRLPVQGGVGYIIDTQSRTIRPLCSNHQSQYESARWLDSLPHTLAYVRTETAGMESLNLLDAENWEYLRVDSTRVSSPVSTYRPIGFVDFIIDVP